MTGNGDRFQRSARRISRAALAPDPPVRPVPGCVPEPHKIQVANRRPILPPAQQRPHRQQLVERQLAMEDVAAGQPVRRVRDRAA